MAEERQTRATEAPQAPAAAPPPPGPPTQAEKPKHRPQPVRMVILILIVAGIAAWIWYGKTHREGYTGGDVVTTGTVEAVHVQLSFKVAGRIADLQVDEGSQVRAGELVARLETQDLDVAVATARASLESARAALAEARANRRRAAQDDARQRELMKSDATTEQQADNARAAAQVAVAQVAAREAQIRQQESVVRQAELQRSYAELHASDAGQVTEKIHQPGEMVMVGTPIVTLSQLDTVKVNAAVDETRIGAIRPGDSVRVRVYTFDRRWFDGVVSDINPAGEFATRKDWGAQRRDIRTFDVTALLPNPEHLLKDGMTAEVTIVPRASGKPLAEVRP
jgi:RND family efflux transporter MFP subunit